MKNLWVLAGRATYILAWPGLYLYLRNSQRSRIIVQTGDKVLVLKDWLGEGKWKLPGGGIHKNEPAAKSAQRELFEETGISVAVNQLKSRGTLETKSHGAKIKFHIFSCKLSKPTDIKRQKFEIIDSQWISLKEIANFKISKNTELILKKYGQL